MERVWFSGAAMTQGVVYRKIDGVPIRVYSPMKTIANLLKYRSKVGIELANGALLASVSTNQYSPYRLLHFARICRVKRWLVFTSAKSALEENSAVARHAGCGASGCRTIAY